MGSNLKVYIGAYVLIKTEPTTAEVTSTRCPDHGLIFGSVNFCPSCGKPVLVVIDEITRYKTLMDLTGPDDESLTEVQIGADTRKIYAIPNRPGVSCNVEISDYLSEAVEIPNHLPVSLINKFEIYYGDLIGELKPKVISIEVKFGILTYYYFGAG